jgi:hypothetical protein
MKLTRYLIFLGVLLILSLFKTSAQQNYGDITVGQRVSIFTESFENNNNNWITDNQWISGKLINGKYDIICKNYKQNTGLTYKSIPVDQKGNFEVEASFALVNGSGALVFGLTKAFDHFRIEIDDRKNFAIIKNIPSKNKVEKIFSAREESLIKGLGFFNKLTVRKYQNTFYIFLNDIMLRQINNITLAGDDVGFSVGLNSEILVDYLNVYYIKDNTGPILADKKSVKQDSLNSNDKIIVSACSVQKDTLKKTIQSDSLIKPSQRTVNVIPLPVAPSGPVITWVMPSGMTTPLSTYTNTARIKVNIKSRAAVKSVLFYVNGASRGDGDIMVVPGEAGSYSAEKLITLNPGENNVYLVVTNADGASIKSDPRYFTNPLATTPEITWGLPLTSPALVNSESITLEVCIKSPAELLSAKVLVDGVQVAVGKVFQRSEAGDCNYVWKPQIILREGDNSIYINAENIAGSTLSENRIIKFNKAVAEKRLALVFGNSDYLNGTRLKNPVNDANLMEATLKDLGFTVIKQLNADRDSMMSSIREFSKKLSDYNVALFYYAGHGIQVDGVNYLIPINAKLENKEDCKWEAVAVNTVTDEFKRNSANTNVVILDACRNNPYKSWVRGGEIGFKALSPINGTIISFSTSEGATAADGDGANGLFTEELVKQMVIPQQIESVFKQTRKVVMTRSKGLQMPTEWSYLTGDFYFRKK